MPRLVVIKNPLAPFERELFPLDKGQRPIDWLQEHYPDGCGGQLCFFVNDKEMDLDDLDYLPEENDIITFAINPCGLDPITISILVSVVLTALSYALSALLSPRPSPPRFTQADNAEPSPVYSVRSNQNTARLGEPVPVPYGMVLHTPDICSQPYRFFANDIEEYFDMLLCLGVGEFDVHQVLVGDSDATVVENSAMQWHVAPPSEHLNAIGNLVNVFGATLPFYENMLTSAEVGEQEFTFAGDTSGYFRMGKSGQKGRHIYIDIFWPGGLYQLNDWNDVVSTTVDWWIRIVKADPNGVPVAGTEQNFFMSQSTVTRIDPLRKTYHIDTGDDAVWLVKMERVTQQYPNGDETNKWVWVGLRMRVQSNVGPYYGSNTTLMAVRFRATAISSNANNQIRVKLQRKLPPLGVGTAISTASPADAFVDMMIDTTYGARRPLSEVDTTRLAALKSYWLSGVYTNYTFNAIYTGKTTIWEALTDTMAPMAAFPLPLGSLMSVAQDGIKNVRTMLWSDQNIISDSFAITYSYDRQGDNDGIEIEFRNPLTFAPAYVRYPTTSQDPDKQTLFGCTDSRHASEYARLQWQRRGGNRRVVAFDTELEGLIPIPGERAGISQTLPYWGQSGFVRSVSGLTVTLDRKLKWTDPMFTPPYVIAFRDEFGGMSNIVQCIKGATDDVAILASDPWSGTSGSYELSQDQEITHFIFGDASHVIKDFILTNISPKDQNQVSIFGSFYDPSVYANTLAFLAIPVP